MTQPRDFDRLARAWLDLMPDEAPDRVIANVLQAVDATPQVRRPQAALRRFTQMNRLTVAFAAAAAIVVVVVGGAILYRPSSNVGATPTPSPSASPIASPAPSPVPTAGTAGVPSGMVARWLGSSRANPYIESGAGVLLLVTADQVTLAQSNQERFPVIAASTSTIGSGRVRLEAMAAGGGCPTGDVGTYDASLSPSGETMIVRGVADACADRLTALAGTWWRDDCKVVGTNCLGVMDAGTYGSQYLDPAGRIPWQPRYGRLAFTVPAGWANTVDWPGHFGLTLAPTYTAAKTVNGDGGANVIRVLAAPAAAIQNGKCDGVPDPAVQGTVTSLGQYLMTVKGLQVTPATDVLVDGRAGKVYDLGLKAGAGACAGAPSGYVQTLAGQPGEDWSTDIAGAVRQRLILVDLGSGHVVAIVVEAPDSAHFEQVLAQAMPVVESFRFN